MTPNINPYNENKGRAKNTHKTNAPYYIHKTHNASDEIRVNKNKKTGRAELKLRYGYHRRNIASYVYKSNQT